MNPEAVEWLESLDENEHLGRFRPAIAEPGKLFGIKEDHESCRICPMAGLFGQPELLVIG